jgi:uncharacterized cupin superfamily protein
MALSVADTRDMEKAQMRFYKADACTMAQMTVQPGWQWTKCMKSVAKTDLCEMAHVGCCLKGAMRVRHADGKEYQVKAGDFYEIKPGHDAWVEGDEACEMVDFKSADKMQETWKN